MSETSFSLLQRLQAQPDADAWRRLVDLYSPLIRGWLRGFHLQEADLEDLSQDVLGIVVRKLPEFQHNSRPGSFRAWLRVITVNRLREFWRAKRHQPTATGGSDFLKQLEQLEDSASALSRLWDGEHDRHVVRRLLELIEPQFEANTQQAFRRVVIEGRKAAEVAAELGISVNAVLLAKSRILRQLRRELGGLVDSL